MIPFEHWLSTLESSELASLLSRRPDATAPPARLDLGELAERLEHPESVALAIRGLTMPDLEVLRTIACLGYQTTVERLADVLDANGSATGPEHETRIMQAVDDLAAHGLAWRRDTDVVAHLTMQLVLDSEATFGRCLFQSLSDLGRDRLRTLERRLRLEPASTKRGAVESIRAHLSDPDTVSRLVDSAPPDVRDRLHEIAAESTSERDEEDLFSRYRLDASAYRRTVNAGQWAGEYGILTLEAYSNSYRMPSEVAIALRGKAFLPFTPVPPPLVRHQLDAELVGRECAASTTAMSGQTLAVLDLIARSGAAQVKSGGVGAREITRISKAVGTTPESTRLILELSRYAGLLTTAGQRAEVTADFAVWRDAAPAERMAALLLAWWLEAAVPTSCLDDQGKVVPALALEEACRGCRAARHTALMVLREISPEGASREAVGQAVAWASPLSHADQDARGVLALIWAEAQALGVVAAGALTELGHRLVAGDGAGVVAQLAVLLPGSTDEATFGSDLTVMVVGSPSSRVTRLLDSCAVREGRGGATTWRLSAAAVRAALDAGTSAAELESQLAAIATTGLPQPLVYLIADVARRHGLLRVAPATSVVTSADTALLAEVANDRALLRLGVRLVAPTVLAAEATPEELLAALRKAGYFPVADQVASAHSITRDGPAPPEAPPRDTRLREVLRSMAARHQPPIRAEEPLTPAALADRLVGRLADADEEPEPSETERAVARAASRLTPAEVRQLAHAIDSLGAVTITYRGQTGGVHRRRIREIVRMADRLFAFCELRQGEREFVIGNILSVHPG